MQTIDVDEPVSTLFEACGAFASGGHASPVCGACGWLETEHEPEITDVRALPVRREPSPAPKQLAS